MIGIIDYGMGNLGSISNALDYMHEKWVISSETAVLDKADKLILPGLGAFGDAIQLLKEKGLDDFIRTAVSQGKPLLGICLGMQLLFDTSTEHGQYEGLGILEGDIIKLDVPLKIPHMGWNKLAIKKREPLFRGLPDNSDVYFVHSYHLDTEADIVSATTTYGKEIQIAAQKDHVYALQFHPEKSGEIGLQIMKNFIDL
ncbi:imidazole glycerol phosphate synthase subunit HisH [Vallitalea pronyensis]|uniref:Imidazole glycerol phosphate synthase subunit HisH n=1 Tax=Vallitalea pronyensis TaxID=1348613 RepID=A0A8J8MKL6_9FIRM|nr:imidazole glycerol phosphate synthase subunit HisH [Vallitalea pronyensis]QUI23304.1 imidazole glycerol phosphate synthase subunit HisH [Vallitalea pronyensis]